ncbi:MAG: mercury(II) reductase [Anaerolineae bacterium]|jgi:mercuric reductase|nr:mercury(II) reductase [Anaerolineae bacterium]
MEQQQIKLRIGGMTCVHCAEHVSQALETVAGVRHVNLPGWRASHATVTADADVSTDALTQAVQAVGYTALVEEQLPLQPEHTEPTRDTSAYDFDLLVIGGGSGGFAAAIAATDLGKRVGMINAGTIGGTCTNVGCVPSKAFIRAAEAWHSAGHHPFEGIKTAQVDLDWPTVRAQKDALVSELRQSKYVDVLAAYPDITFIEGRAVFKADGSVHVGDRQYRASRYVIATGAQPRMLPIPGLEEAQPLNSTTLMDLDELPRSLIILGGRAVALELGQMMARLGVEVLILQRSLRLVPEHEPEIGLGIQDYLEQEGIGVLTGVTVERLSREGDTRVVHVRLMGQQRKFRADQVLMALGRQPNTAGLGLEHVGVAVDDSDSILVNEYQQTTNPIIYATGDVTTNPEYVYVAAAGGAVAARNALTDAQKPLDLSALPGVIFTDPQIATVGLTEAQARQQGYEIRASTLSLEHVPRAQVARDTRGFIKLVADAATGRLLGAHILAAEGGEVIQTATLAVKFGLKLDDLTDTLFPYLTQVEGLKLAALSFTKDVAKLSCCAV